MTDRTKYCCLCGAKRKPTQKPVDGFSNECSIVHMNQHRPMLEGRWEHAPQMIVNVSMWRNGGTAPGNTHICDDCIVVGLQHAKKFVDDSLEALS